MGVLQTPLGMNVVDNPIVDSPYIETWEIGSGGMAQDGILTEGGAFILTEGGDNLTTE